MATTQSLDHADDTERSALDQAFASLFLWSGPALVFVLALLFTR